MLYSLRMRAPCRGPAVVSEPTFPAAASRGGPALCTAPAQILLHQGFSTGALSLLGFPSPEGTARGMSTQSLDWPTPRVPQSQLGPTRAEGGATHLSSLPLSGSRSWLVRAETRSGSTGLGHGGGVGKEGGARCSRFQASWGLGRPCSTELSLGAKMPLP